ncbi:elongation factor 4 [Patescibacteria group bacterium]|nr:elongation factor 4 [Patescibacteria group bacterium]
MDGVKNIRNFVIIAHIDHGKSTLADRFLELTQTIEKRKMKDQVLDQMDLEREKGITIKMQPVRMNYQGYLLNLIDTPGHVDFTYEVSRALAAVEGAILLVDATKGVQAQTLANLSLAKKQGLVIIPVINKIDSPLARTEDVVKEVASLLHIKEDEILRVSAKNGTGVKELLSFVIENVPAPKGRREAPLKALIFDSSYDSFRGVVTYVRVVDGEIKVNDKISFFATKAEGSVKEVGYFLPSEHPSDVLFAGEIGYVATGIKEAEKVRIGDTMISQKTKVEPLAGYETPKPMVYVSLYPQDIDDFDALKTALTQLKLNDPSFSFEPESKEALGRGFRCGFLGVLHSEIIAERIQREFALEIVISRPSVEFQVTTERQEELSVKTSTDWPDEQKILLVKEPWVHLEIIVPRDFFPQVTQLLLTLGGFSIGVTDLGEERLRASFEVPLRQVIADLYDKLKSVSQGMASMDYEILEMRPADLVKLEIWTAGENQDALSVIIPRKDTYKEGKAIVEKLKKILPPQLFEVALQAVVDNKIIARETLKAQRRDVTGALYGGDVTRKKKLLEKQKKGKKELKAKGRINIPSKVFLELFRS